MWISWAIHKPIQVDPGDGPRWPRCNAIILHTAVVRGRSLYPWPGPVEAHLYLRLNGDLEQYLDTDLRADHAWDANSWSIAMESEDSGRSADPGPWNAAQLDTIVRLCRTLSIPAQPLRCMPSDGIGYHRQCESWNRSHHSCPGDAKVAQIAGIIARLKGADMDATEVRDIVREMTDYRRLSGMVLRIQNQPRPAGTMQAEGWDFADAALKAGASGGVTKAEYDKHMHGVSPTAPPIK
jgi:N-acetylmuramoyl-L-alanine amidase-like protein